MDAQGPLGGSPDRHRSLSGDGGNLKYVMVGLVLAVAGAFIYVQRHYGAAETPTPPTVAAPTPAVTPAPVAVPTPPKAADSAPAPATSPKMVVQPLDPPAEPKPVHAKAPKKHRAPPRTASSSLPHLPSPPPGDDG